MSISRLAPSPTGAQHLGNARTYLLAWLSARAQNGRVIFRLEDIDSPRVKSWANQQSLDDLLWLGLNWDEGPDVGGPNTPYIQSHRIDLYHSLIKSLQDRELVYPCTCSRSDIAAAASAPHIENEGPIYPGTCSHRSVADALKLHEQPFCWRLRSREGQFQFHDGLFEEQKLEPAKSLGDFVIAKQDNSPAYQLAVVADDHAMGVTEVVRGSDLLVSTFRQLQLYKLFDWAPPKFIHVPLVVGEDGRRLAKRHGDTRLSMFREKGISPEILIGHLAFSCGLTDDPKPTSPHALISSFAWNRIQPLTPYVWLDSLQKKILSGLN